MDRHPFHKLLLRVICQYYNLQAVYLKTFQKIENIVFKITKQPNVILSDFYNSITHLRL